MKLSQAITEYVALKRAMGAGFDADARHLKALALAVGANIAVADLTEDHLRSYLAPRGVLSSSWHRKYVAVSGFNRFAMGRGYTASLPLPKLRPKKPQTFVPYILSSEELHRLLDAVPYRRKDALLQPPTVRMILLLLYGAGLRLREALSLTLADVNLRESLLTIRETKFHKSRLVSMGCQLCRAMTLYFRWRHEQGHSQGNHSPFFVTRTGAPVNHDNLRGCFEFLRDRVGLRKKGTGQKPRLHDLRHSFAVHRLLSWYRQGADVQSLLPKLATYLGHVCICSTQVYLTMTPELLQEASTRFEKYALPAVQRG
ncbi:MAG: tyrosine-type recombinase/integrase [Acidobacteria bacterium]|nr:tyrosine-type recombinase/integrase [Acidobacteriota bacterium]